MKEKFIPPNELFNIGQLTTAEAWWPTPGYNYDIFEYEGKKYLRQLDYANQNEKPISVKNFSKNKNCIIDLIKVVSFNSNTINWNDCSTYITEKKLLK